MTRPQSLALRDWEQGRSEPDQPAKAYLTVIARDPQGVERASHPVRVSDCRRNRGTMAALHVVKKELPDEDAVVRSAFPLRLDLARAGSSRTARRQTPRLP